MKGRVRLTVEVVIYRIEEWEDPETHEWIPDDCDCTSEEIIAEGTVQTLGQTTTSEGTTWYDAEPTPTELETEAKLQKCADAAYGWGQTFWNALPTGS